MSRAERRLCGAVFAAALLLYLAWRSVFFNFDGVACATAIELDDFKHLVHGNHLAYGPLGWLFHRALGLLGYGGRAVLSLQLLDALLGAAGAAVFASILKRSGRPDRECALGAAALAVSHAWWFWSLEAQVYMLGALFAALAAREALGDRPRPALVGLWAAAAALGHVGNLMAVPALAWLLRRRLGARSLRPAALSGLALGASAYAAAGALAVRPASAAELRLWLLGSAALGEGRSFGWHSVPLLEAVPLWLSSTGRIFAEFRGLPPAAAVAGAALAAVPLAAAARGAREGGESARFWLLWLAGYAALFLFWEPDTLVYRVTDLLPLWALACAGAATLPARARAAGLAAWAAAALAFNLAFVVRPAADPARNPDLQEALWASERVEPSDWLVAGGRGAVLVPYFGARRPLNLNYHPDDAGLLARVAAIEAGGGRVFATSRTLALAGRFEALRSRLEPVAEAGGLTLYRLRAKASRAAAARRS